MHNKVKGFEKKKQNNIKEDIFTVSASFGLGLSAKGRLIASVEYMLAGLPTCKNNWTQVRFANPA
jgi:hypothetical protein